MDVIEVSCLRKRYSEKDIRENYILEDVSFKVEKGEIICIVGHSGIGKTTLLRAVAGLIPSTSGRIMLGGKPPRFALRKGKIGISFQNPAVIPWKTVEENIMLPLEFGRKGSLRKNSDRLLSLTGLERFRRFYPSELSGGMIQRVSLARAMVSEPDYLLFDEPFGSLDVITRDRLNLEFVRIWSCSGVTVLMVTHSIKEAVFFSDRVIVLSGRPASILEEVEIDLPRPRGKDEMFSERALHFEKYIYGILQGSENATME